MATKKTTKTKKSPIVVEQPKLPTIKHGEYTFVLSEEELFSLAQILSFSRDVFKQMSLDRGVAGDGQAEAIFAARSELSSILFHKMKLIANIGEPTSRELH